MPRPTPDWDGSVSEDDKDAFRHQQEIDQAKEDAEAYQQQLDDVERERAALDGD